MNKTNEQLRNEVGQTFDKVIDWLDKQEDSFINQTVIEEKWTAAQHMDHIVKTSKATCKGFHVPKEKLKEKFGLCEREQYTYENINTKYRSGLSVGLKSPEKFVGEEGREFEKSELRENLLEQKNNFQEAISSWSVEDMKTYMMPNPAIQYMSFYEYCMFNSIHLEHHLETLTEKYRP